MNDKLAKISRNATFWTLTKPQQTAIQRLFEGNTVKSVGEELKVDRHTIANWKKDILHKFLCHPTYTWS